VPVAVNVGTRIHYEVTGAGPVVVLMHGIGDTGEIWRQLGAVDRLAAHFTVVTIDLRGLGRSDMPSEPAAYTRDVRRDDTIAVLDAIEALTTKVVDAGKVAGTIARTPEEYAYWRDRGVGFFLTGANALLGGAATAYVQGVRAVEEGR